METLTDIGIWTLLVVGAVLYTGRTEHISYAAAMWLGGILFAAVASI